MKLNLTSQEAQTIINALIRLYKSYPVTIDWQGCAAGYGNWGLNEDEYRDTLEIAKLIELVMTESRR